MGPERRICARRILYSPEYLDMGADNGGVVVELSESGLRFQAVSRVEDNSGVALSFSLGTGYRIDVQAHVVWVSPRGNSGGVAFKNLSTDSRSLIREWLAKPESEQRAEADISTPEGEEESGNTSLESAPPAKAAEPDEKSEPRLAPAAQEEILAAQAFDEPSRIGRIEEVSAPGEPIFPLDVSEPRSQSAHPQSPQLVEPTRPATETSQSRLTQQSAVAGSAVAEKPIAPRATVKEFAVRNARIETVAPAPETEKTPLAPRSWSFARPTSTARSPRLTERKSSQHSGASFSAVPSISAWGGGKGEIAPLIQKRPSPMDSGAPLFPPGDTENIFARRWTPPELAEAEHPGGSKAFLIVVLALLFVIAALLLYAYAGGYRQQIGAAIERVGSSVAGQSDASNPAPTVNGASSSASPAPALQKNAPPQTTPKADAPHSPALAVPPVKSNFASNPTAPPAKPDVATDAQLTNQTVAQANSKPQPSQAEAQPPSQAASEPAYLRQTAQNQTAKPVTAANSAAAAAILQNAARSEYLRAQQYLDGTASLAPDPSEAAEWFWRSLEAGDMDAALPLADLYLQGKGVSRNCTQARILLDAAVRKGNAEAAHKLGQLPESCN